MSDPTCQERIYDHFLDRETDLKVLLSREDDDAYDELSEYAMCIDIYKVVRIELSWGGPQDFLECKVVDDEVEEVTYHFADWFDHAEMNVPQDSAMFDYAVWFVEGLTL